jgi:hypothetical protein
MDNKLFKRVWYYINMDTSEGPTPTPDLTPASPPHPESVWRDRLRSVSASADISDQFRPEFEQSVKADLGELQQPLRNLAHNLLRQPNGESVLAAYVAANLPSRPDGKPAFQISITPTPPDSPSDPK